MFILEAVWQTVLDIASWMLNGTWYMIVLSISGGIAVIFMPRAFVFGIENFFDFEVPIPIKAILTFVMLLAFVVLVTGLGWVFVTRWLSHWNPRKMPEAGLKAVLLKSG